MTRSIDSKRNYCIVLGSGLLLFCIYLIHIQRVFQLSIVYDEFGYWNAGAFFAGLDWSNISFQSPYYSYGYGIILAPLLKFISDDILRFRTAVAINAIMYVSAYFISIRVMSQLFYKVKQICIYGVCFFCACYVANLYLVNTTMSEALTYLVYWILIYTMYEFFKTEKLGLFVLIIIETGFLYSVHQRTLGVVLAVVLTIIVYAVSNHKVNIKRLVLSVILAAALVVVLLFIKELLVSGVYNWNDASLAGRNDYSGQFSKIKTVFSIDGFVLFVRGVCGKVFYIIVSTFGLALWGFIDVVSVLINKVRQKTIFSEKDKIYVFAVLSMMFMIGVNSVYMLEMGRIDTVFYGRYSEFTISPFLMIGSIKIISTENKKYENALTLLSVPVLGVVIKGIVETRTSFQCMQSSGVCLFYDFEKDSFNMSLCVKMFVIVILIIVMTNKLRKQYMFLAIGIGIMTYWQASAIYGLNNEYFQNQQQCKGVKTIADTISEYDESIPIYYLYDREDTHYKTIRSCVVQYYLQDRSIIAIEEDELNQLQGEYFLIQTNEKKVDKNKHLIIDQGGTLVLLVGNESKIAACEKNAVDGLNIDFENGTMQNLITGVWSDYVSNYEEGYVTSCQFLHLLPGEYTITVEIEVSGNKEEKIGGFDVCEDGGEKILYSEFISGDKTVDVNSQVLEYHLSINEESDDAEFRVYTYGNCKLEVKEMKYTQNL